MAKNFVKSVSGILGTRFVEYVAFSVALGRSLGFMGKELGLHWIGHATVRRLV